MESLNRKSWLKLAAAVLVGVVLAYGAYTLTEVPGAVTTWVPSKFTVGGKTFVFTYVATTEAEREAGLMNRQVTNATTMLFAFPYFSEWSFWMFETNTSLDMIWVNATGDAGRVVYVVHSAPPCYVSSECAKYAPASPANYVIEAKGGFAATNGITSGTEIKFS